MKTIRYAFVRSLPIMAGYIVLGLGVSLVCLLIFGSSDFLIPSMVGITAALTVLRGFMQKNEADHAV